MLKDSIDVKNKWKFDAYLGQDWWLYYSHYKTALDELVILIEGNLPVNTVALPTLFLIRHGMELGLKANIIRMEKVSNARPILTFQGKNSHSIEAHYDIFIAHLTEIRKLISLEKIDSDKINDYIKKIEPLKVILHNLDKGSYNFRYPINSHGVNNFGLNEKVNIAEMKNN